MGLLNVKNRIFLFLIALGLIPVAGLFFFKDKLTSASMVKTTTKVITKTEVSNDVNLDQFARQQAKMVSQQVEVRKKTVGAFAASKSVVEAANIFKVTLDRMATELATRYSLPKVKKRVQDFYTSNEKLFTTL